MKSLFFITLVISLASCSRNRNRENENQSETYIGEIFEQGGALSNEDFQIALSICEAYRDKREYYASGLRDHDKNQRHSLSSSDCEGRSLGVTSIRSRITSTSGSESFKLTSNHHLLLKDIPSDKYGLINDLCTSVLNTEVPISTREIGSRSYKYVFNQKSGNHPKYEVVTYKQSSRDENFRSYKIDKFYVSIENDEKVRGKVIQRTQSKSCLTPNRFKTIKQNIIL